jgi:hypothetical protein
VGKHILMKMKRQHMLEGRKTKKKYMKKRKKKKTPKYN